MGPAATRPALQPSQGWGACKPGPCSAPLSLQKTLTVAGVPPAPMFFHQSGDGDCPPAVSRVTINHNHVYWNGQKKEERKEGGMEEGGEGCGSCAPHSVASSRLSPMESPVSPWGLALPHPVLVREL